MCMVFRFTGWIAVLTMISGCSMFRQSIREQNPEETSMLTATFDHHDLRNMAREMTKEIINHPFPPPSDQPPIIVSMGIQNRTKSHLDTRALSDSITTLLLDTGKLRFVDIDQRDALMREQGFQVANATQETKVSVGRQLGARYMMSGAFIQLDAKSGRQVRMSRKKDIYYQLTVTITDIESGLMVMRKQIERVRRASKPIIGW